MCLVHLVAVSGVVNHAVEKQRELLETVSTRQSESALAAVSSIAVHIRVCVVDPGLREACLQNVTNDQHRAVQANVQVGTPSLFEETRVEQNRDVGRVAAKFPVNESY